MTTRTHAEIQELLGAYALDAVEPDEADIVTRHVEECPRCRDELSSHREVAGMLAYGGQEAPEGLWDRIITGIHEAPGEIPAGMPPTLLSPGQAPISILDHGRRGRRVPMGGRWIPGVAAAAVALVALLGVEVLHLQNRTDHLSGQVAAMAGQPNMQSVHLALSEPGARKVRLRGLAGGSELDAVILPGGTGYLYDSTLSPLPPGETYQLWGVVGSEQISYGLIGGTPAQVTGFRAGAGVQALAVTAEVAGGVERSSHNPVVVGTVT